MSAEHQSSLEAGISDFLDNFSIEMTPSEALRATDIKNFLKAGTNVYLTSIAGASFDDQLAAASRIREQGLSPVPHLAARDISSIDDLSDRLSRLVGDAGVIQILAIAGERPRVAGEFQDTIQLLKSGVIEKAGIRKIGITGYPEGNPNIPDTALWQSLGDKHAIAQSSSAEFYIVTQFCFDPKAIITWVESMRAEGIDLPIDVGIPGRTSIRTLLHYARQCGIGPSMHALTSQGLSIARLATVSTPGPIVEDISVHRAKNPRCGIRHAHFFPFGALRETVQWIKDTLETVESPQSGAST